MKFKNVPTALKVSVASATLAAIGITVTAFTDYNSKVNKAARWGVAGLCVVGVAAIVAFAIPNYLGDKEKRA